MLSNTLAVMLFISALILSKTDACSGARTTLRNLVCSSESVFIGRIIKRFDNCPQGCTLADQFNGRVSYLVRNIFNVKEARPSTRVVVLETAITGSLCGVPNLPVRRTFLFTLGEERKGNDGRSIFGLSLCARPTLFRKLSNADREFVLRRSALKIACRQERREDEVLLTSAAV